MSYEVTTRVEGTAESVPVAWFDLQPGPPEMEAGTEVVVSSRAGACSVDTAGVAAAGPPLTGRTAAEARQFGRLRFVPADAPT